jgi:hypothetical protein
VTRHPEIVDIAKVLERVQKLIALAGSDNENEARNAAVLACRLIRENKISLALSEGEPVRRAPRDPFGGGVRVNYSSIDESDDFFQILRDAMNRKAKEQQEARLRCRCGKSKPRADAVECNECAMRRRAHELWEEECAKAEYAKREKAARVSQQLRDEIFRATNPYPGRRRRDG